MKLTNGDIFHASGPLRELAVVRFPVGVSFRIAQLINTMNVHLGAIEEVRNSLVQKYGTVDELGQLRVPEGTAEFDLFMGEIDELFALETEVDFDKIKLPETGADIEPRVLVALEKFVEV